MHEDAHARGEGTLPPEKPYCLSTVMDHIQIGNRLVGAGHPTYIIAEVSANHNHKIEAAKGIIHAAAEAGADAVKLQTYTPDTLTIRSDKPWFKIKETLWEGRYLYDLYAEAYTPWEWHAELKSCAIEAGLQFFSTPFDPTAVEFLEQLGVPAYKIASFEIVDLELIELCGKTGKPLIVSTGMASLGEIDDAVEAANKGAGGFALLHCNSAYPAPLEEMNLSTIPMLASRYGVPVGLSDHTLGSDAAVAAVAMGASIIEKHITLSRSKPGPDSAFSLEPEEFKSLIVRVRETEKMLGTPKQGPTQRELPSLALRRSLFVVKDVLKGELFTRENVRSIRPANGLPPKFLYEALGKKAAMDIEAGTPLSWDLVAR